MTQSPLMFNKYKNTCKLNKDEIGTELYTSLSYICIINHSNSERVLRKISIKLKED